MIDTQEREAILARVAELEQQAVEIAIKAPNAFFVPNPAQWRFMRLIEQTYADPAAKQKVNIMSWMGANDTGKTRLLAEIAVNMLIGPQSPFFETPFFQGWKHPCRGRLISTQKALEEGLIRELRASLTPFLAPGYPKNAGHPYAAEWLLKDGSRLDLYTWDQAVTQHAGAFVDFLICDEPGKRQVFNEATARLRRGGPVFWAMTPVDDTGLSVDLAWVFDEITKGEETTGANGWSVVYADAEDNCSMHGVEQIVLNGVKRTLRGRVPHEVIEDRRKRWESDPSTLQARFFGRHVRELGRVLKEWDDKKHTFHNLTVHPSWPRYAAIDVHPSKPQVFVYCVLTPFSELLVLREVVSTGLIGEVAAEIREIFMTYGYPKLCLIDPIAATPNPLTGTTIMQEYQSYLPNVPLSSAGKEKVEKQVGIAKTREMLAGIDGRPLLRVHDGCKFTIAQAKRWMIDPRTLAPAKEHDDAWENIYRIVLNLPPFQTAEMAAREQRMLSMSRSSLIPV